MSPLEFKNALAKHQISLTQQQMSQFADYYQFLIEQNQKINLTSITEVGAVYLKHFYDSLTPALFFPDIFSREITLCDVGAGAGFPSLPLKIIYPNLKVTIIDSLNKRIKFLETLVTRLGLTNITLVHGRAEDFARPKQPRRQAYDLVLSRAVAALPILSEFCLPYAKLDGYFLALKGQKGTEELTVSQYAIATLGGKVVATKTFNLPSSTDERELILIQKKKVTPKAYPRKAGVPAKRPLMKKQF